VADRGEPVASCSEWHGDGTAGENDRASHLVAEAPARPMGEAGPGRHESRWQGRQPATADRPRSSATAPWVAASRLASISGKEDSARQGTGKEDEHGEGPHRTRSLARRVYQWAERRP
jgi:hypothetical protein